jgi:hypothetical protein
MIAAFGAALALAYVAALRWTEHGKNALSIALFAVAFPFVIVGLRCMDKLIGVIWPDRRRGFPVMPIEPSDDGKEKSD